MFPEELKKARTQAGMSQKDLAKMLYVSQQAVAKWEIGSSSPTPETLRRISEILNVSLNRLLGSESNNVVPASLDRSVVEINVYGTIPAGIPIEAIEDVIGTEQIPASWLSGGREYFALIVRGDSMYPVYLDGDTVIVRKETTCKTGDDCVVYVNGYDATLKRVKLHDDGSIEICPLNTNYAPRRYSREEAAALPVQIGGVVVELRRRMK